MHICMSSCLVESDFTIKIVICTHGKFLKTLSCISNGPWRQILIFAFCELSCFDLSSSLHPVVCEGQGCSCSMHSTISDNLLCHLILWALCSIKHVWGPILLGCSVVHLNFRCSGSWLSFIKPSKIHPFLSSCCDNPTSSTLDCHLFLICSYHKSTFQEELSELLSFIDSREVNL